MRNRKYVYIIHKLKLNTIMKKLYQIVFYYRQAGSAVAYESKVLFENIENAQLVAHNICKEKGLFYKLVEYYL